MSEFAQVLREITGSTKDPAGAANDWAGTSGLELLGALNAKAGTTGLGLNAVIQAITGQTGEAQGALAKSVPIGEPGAPSAPLNLVLTYDATGLHATWDPPADPGAGGLGEMYLYDLSPDYGQGGVYTTSLDVAAEFLTPGVTYTLTVSAENAANDFGPSVVGTVVAT